MDGFIIVDKPSSLTSHDVVERIRAIVGKGIRVGHTGTLDPSATGVLVIAVGRATRFSEYVTRDVKCYRAFSVFGFRSDTYDSDGNVEPVNCHIEITRGTLEKCLDSFKGDIWQTPPPFSAVKVGGKRAYELARKGIKPHLKPRKVKVLKVELLKFDYPEFVFDVCVSSGTYVRSLVHDIGGRLGCSAIVSKIIRLSSGNAMLDKSISLDKLNKDNIKEYIVPIDSLLNLPSVNIGRYYGRKFANGVRIRWDLPDGIYKVYDGDRFIGVGEIKDKVLMPRKVLS